MTGSAGNNWLQGNGAANTLDGAAGNDRIDGGAGNDLIVGGLGDDSLTGDLGEDTFLFDLGDGNDTIADFETGIDLIDLSGTGLTFGDLSIDPSESSTLIDYTGGTILLVGIDPVNVTEDQFEFVT